MNQVGYRTNAIAGVHHSKYHGEGARRGIEMKRIGRVYVWLPIAEVPVPGKQGSRAGGRLVGEMGYRAQANGIKSEGR